MVKPNTSLSSGTSLESVMNTLLQSALSRSTRASYIRMLSSYDQFCKEHFPSSPALPSNHIMIAHFISFLFIKNYQPSTIASYVSAISYMHKINFYSDPTDSFLVKKVMKGAQNLRGSVDNRLPITKQILSRLMTAVPSVIQSHFYQFLLKAMMSLAFYCFLRVGEMALKSGSEKGKVLQVQDVVVNYESKRATGMTVKITHYKHSDMQTKSIFIKTNQQNPLCPVNAITKYLTLSNHKAGPLFQFTCGTPVSYAFFSSSLKSLLTFIGLNTQIYKGHSFRIGAATSAAAEGIPQTVIQHMGRWKSNAFKNYIRMNNF